MMKCHRCLEARVKELKDDTGRKTIVENDIKMNYTDFIDLARAYYFNLTWIDAFSGKTYECLFFYRKNLIFRFFV